MHPCSISDFLIYRYRRYFPCTACLYCTEYCPQELDIPTIIDLYNDSKYSKGTYIVPKGIKELDEDNANKVLEIIRKEAEKRLVLLVSHSSRDSEVLNAGTINI